MILKKEAYILLKTWLNSKIEAYYRTTISSLGVW